MFSKDAFSHGQIVSKLWLCDNLEPLLKPDMNMIVVGSWYNLIAFMLLTRNQQVCNTITGIDMNMEHIDYSRHICNAWSMGDNPTVTNKIANANTHDYTSYQVAVNCSVEHMSNQWFDKLSEGTLVCIQSSDVIDPKYPWLVSNPNPDIETLEKKYPFTKTLFSGTKEIKYNDWGYKRFMLIGYK